MDRIALESEVARLTASVEPLDGSQPSLARDARCGVLTMVERVADSEVTVLISGESGVGKEIIARELHRRSGRRNKAFVKVNWVHCRRICSSELFGHERGAFTGAQATRVGNSSSPAAAR
jgi:two-component system response regulator AtoC/two-component system nitrogen regulation response regulator NtrX